MSDIDTKRHFITIGPGNPRGAHQAQALADAQGDAMIDLTKLVRKATTDPHLLAELDAIIERYDRAFRRVFDESVPQ